MNADVAAAWLHYVSFMVLFAALVAEHLLTKKPMTPAEIRRVALIDAIYGGAFIAVVLTGTLKLLKYGKGLEFYLQVWQFHAKVALVVVTFLVSIYPTTVFMKYRKRAAGLDPDERLVMPPGLQHGLRLELILVCLIPLFAASLARAVGQFE
jgi:putative membrane protein